MKSPLTKHATDRMQQRGIGASLVEILLSQGNEIHDRRGAVIHHLSSKRKREAIARELRSTAQALEKGDGLYLVEAGDGGAIITVGHNRDSKSSRNRNRRSKSWA